MMRVSQLPLAARCALAARGPWVRDIEFEAGCPASAGGDRE